MKIAVDARTLGSRPSGIGMYLNDFLEQLTKYEEFEWVLITDVAESEYMKKFKFRGIEVHEMGREIYRSAEVYKYFAYLKEELLKIKPDIFWEVNTIIPVKLKGDFKTLITIHDMFPIEHVKYFGKVYSMYFRMNLRKTLKNTDMILYNSEQTKKSTEKFFPVAKKKANCNAYIISNPLGHYEPPRDDNYFLYVGNMEKRKGVDLLVKAYEEYRKKGGSRPLILAGKMQEPDIEQLVENALSNVEGFFYLGYITHTQRYDLYNNCSCFVFPSKAEGFGMPILEVMKHYKPILCSDLPIFDEIVGDCIKTFSLKGTEADQIESLSNSMQLMDKVIEENKKSSDELVDRQAYEDDLAKYTPDRLGEMVRDFILGQM